MPATGSYNSALGRPKMEICAIRPTREEYPAVLQQRRLGRSRPNPPMLPVRLHVPVAGSYNSHVVTKAGPFPPARSTLPV